jgi:uncharacterized protein with NAD-binding domain and iron-sulfur cluster
MSKRKIAILGGGWGSISTALYLTHPDNPKRDEYDITIYQMGWRLGGKGASGRGVEDRVEEHGLHVWMGAYENAFKAIREVYDEVQPIYRRITNYENNPFKSWEDAFKKHSYLVVGEYHDDKWTTWGFDFPTNDEKPGDGDTVWLSPWDYVQMLLEWLLDYHSHSEASRRTSESREKEGLFGSLSDLWDDVTDGIENAAQSVLDAAVRRLHRMDSLDDYALPLIAKAMDSFIIALLQDTRDLLGGSERLRRDITVMELAAVTIKGLIDDGILTDGEGLDKLDDYDLREWLHRHGASSAALGSGVVQGIYDLVFAYENGEINRPNLAAGVGVRTMIRLPLTYRGAIFYKMQAGMGDVVFAPPYLVLKERGVKFRFFHKVEHLALTADKSAVETIRMGIQATPKDPAAGYAPLVNVKDLPCWPAEPFYDQLNEGAALRARGINLESAYTPWQPVAQETLTRGIDFDDVVLGIPVAALPQIAGELMAANPAFDAMVQNVATVRTQALQVWLDRDLKGLGWTEESPVLASYVEPMNTWADMSQLIPLENHPEGSVGNVAYFCGPMEGGIAPLDDHEAPARATARVRQTSLTFLQSLTGFLWPDAAPKAPDGYPLNPKGTDFDRLVAPAGATGMARFEAQYVRANISPSERYTLSLKGTTRYRLRADQSGFQNVWLAGDWTRNGINAGAIEPTTMSGMQAANAISGYPLLTDIIGYDVPGPDKHPRPTR